MPRPRAVEQNEVGKKEGVTQPSKIAEEVETLPKFPSDKTKIDDNILKRLDLLQYGPRRNQKSCLKMKSVQQLTANYVNDWNYVNNTLTWHQKFPYALASSPAGCGNIQFLSGIPNDPELRPGCPLKFETKAEIGIEGNRAFSAMKFHERDLNLLYGAGSGCVARMDLENGSTTHFYITRYNHWFSSLDLNFTRNMVLAGDNQGIVHHFSIDGKLMGTWRLHERPVRHLEFSKKDPNLLVSTSFDGEGSVKIWDIRNIKHSRFSTECEPFLSLDHNFGVRCARFSSIDGSRILITDLQDEIIIYQGSLWKDHTVIKRHHFKHFHYITPADWHPVNEYIVVGRYSESRVKDHKDKRRANAINIFDSYSGELVETICPPQDEICRSNVFNPTGEYLATGRGRGLILWEPGLSLDKLP